jgi:tRNA nucleotidyltransferase (CCA-adding enzyme)
MKEPLIQSDQWSFLKTLEKQYPKGGFYLVGGAVRDALLKRKPKDIDFVVTGIELDDLSEALSKLGEVNLVGKRFGVLKFKPKDANPEKVVYDIALPRTEFSLSFSGAYRDFDVQSDPNLSIETDLSRRDFTINAMAYNVITHEFVDPFLGKKDLEKKVIRTVGAAVTRFQEDYSRMLRALRFSVQLDFTVTEKVSKTIKKMAPHLHDKIDNNWVISREVISKEFLKAFDANPINSLKLFDEHGLLEILFPDIATLQSCEQSPPYHLEGNVLNHIFYAFEQTESKEYKSYFPKPISLMTKLGILFHDVGKSSTQSTDDDGRKHFKGHASTGAELTKKVCKNMSLGSSEYYPFKCDALSWIVKHHLFSIEHQKESRSKIELEQLFFSDKYPSESLLQVMLADLMGSKTGDKIRSTEPFEALWAQLKEMAPNGELPAPLLTGSDVIETLQTKPGPAIKGYLDQIREAQLNHEISTKEEALNLLKTL